MESQQAKKPNSVATFVCVSIDLTFPFSLILQHTLTVIASSASRVGILIVHYMDILKNGQNWSYG